MYFTLCVHYMNKYDSHSVNIECIPSVMISGFKREIDETSSNFGQVPLHSPSHNCRWEMYESLSQVLVK